MWGGAIVGFGLTRSLPVALVFLALAGMGDMISEILRNALLQIYAPDRLRGRAERPVPGPGHHGARAGQHRGRDRGGAVLGDLLGGQRRARLRGRALLLGALIPALRHATLAGPATEHTEPALPEPAD